MTQTAKLMNRRDITRGSFAFNIAIKRYTIAVETRSRKCQQVARRRLLVFQTCQRLEECLAAQRQVSCNDGHNGDGLGQPSIHQWQDRSRRCAMCDRKWEHL